VGIEPTTYSPTRRPRKPRALLTKIGRERWNLAALGPSYEPTRGHCRSPQGAGSEEYAGHKWGTVSRGWAPSLPAGMISAPRAGSGSPSTEVESELSP
jgi:hypothetical protein